MISHKHKFIFIHIPKTAGKSMEEALRDESCQLLPGEWDHERVRHTPDGRDEAGMFVLEALGGLGEPGGEAGIRRLACAFSGGDERRDVAEQLTQQPLGFRIHTIRAR